MVKKILLDGSPCPKCAQAEQILRKRGYWDCIERIVIAREGDAESEGMRLASELDVELAPFFVVEDDSGDRRVHTRVFEFIKSELEDASSGGPPVSEGSFDPVEAQRRYRDMDPQSILAEAQSLFGTDLTLAFSGAEDVVLIDMASKNGRPFSVFSLDTGRLHGETYAYLDTVSAHYGVPIDVYTPDPALLEPFLKEKGMNSFYREGHRECCGIRKVEPLGRALAGRRAWATGLRRDQSPATRTDLVHVERDSAHTDASGRTPVKFNPLLDWDAQAVWDYIRANGVPYNPLHDAGYRSIGCEPCTRPSRPGEHERMARWWWEAETRRECGLHVDRSK